jgi:hypothetical protein
LLRMFLLWSWRRQQHLHWQQPSLPTWVLCKYPS